MFPRYFSRRAGSGVDAPRFLISVVDTGLLTQYCEGDKIEKNEMGWACGSYG